MTDEEKKEMEALKKERDEAKSKLEEIEKKSKEKDDDDKDDDEDDKDKKKSKSKSKDDDEDNEDDDDLNDKVRRRRKAAEETAHETKRLENALKFNLGVSEFVKTNSDLLPSEISDILKTAEKEKYDSAIEKSGAVRTAVIKSFFAIQANIDLLTSTQKTALEDYLKLTKNGREERSEFIFENIFEPALESLKRVKKAEEIGISRSGFKSTSKVEDGYKARLMQTSRKTYLGEKEKGAN